MCFDIYNVRLHQARGFYFLWGGILPVVTFLPLVLCFAGLTFLDGKRRSVVISICDIVLQIFSLTRFTMWTNSPRHGVALVLTSAKRLS